MTPPTSSRTWRRLSDEAAAAGVDYREARWMGETASGLEGTDWILALDDEAASLASSRFAEMVARRLAGEPLQYVLGSWGFLGLDLMVDRRVLIPRPETEWVVQAALKLLPDGATPLVVDLGTGSGAIALAVAAERWPRVRVVATDRSGDALAVARANLAGLGQRGTVVELREGDWFGALDEADRGRVDLVVTNPPYVGAGEVLPPEVRDWEPLDALVAGPTGLEAIERIVADAPGWLAPGGWLVSEIGETQGEAAGDLAVAAGLVDVEVRRDLSARDRILMARAP